MSAQSLYDILGVLESASLDEIRVSYRRKIRTIHPDTGGSEEAAKQINAAYEILSDPTRRAEYDRSRRIRICPMCDQAVATDDELSAHIVRHRAEVAAAQQVRYETASQDDVDRKRRTADVAAAEPETSSPGHRRGTPTSPTSPAGKHRLWRLGVVVVALVGVIVGIGLVTEGLSSRPPAESVAPASENLAATTIVADDTAATVGTTTPAVVTTATASPSPTIPLIDAKTRDAFVLISDLEKNEQYLKASGPDWYIWSDEYAELADRYLVYAEVWDRHFLDHVEKTEPGFGQMVSHALLRRSDGYRLVYEASTPGAIDADIDSFLWGAGVDAIDEASTIFDEIWIDLPAGWQPDAGVPRSAMDNLIGMGLPKADPIAVADFVVGDCYQKTPSGEPTSTVDRIDCRAGAMEIFWIEDIGPYFEGFPGDDHVQGFVQELCDEQAWARFPDRVMNQMAVWWWAPSAELWSVRDTRIACVFEL